ncbi:hypothetical protein [Roseiterribacter gracilis]|uniref:Uncharacterized protein n=1 Tax=Roseiterribacter gracilis TaxID=2812848 RepID=A0A8S8XFE1_9PROT|nr:hypothetical protein TMPK1_23640 [Rhodospirillales bacterium TMPK1]
MAATTKARPVRKSDAKWSTRVAMFFTLVVAGVMFPVTIIVGVGMLPTAVAFYVDRSPQKSTALTVGALNACGVVPWVIQLFQDGFSMQHAMLILAKSNTWLAMYGAAAAGWMMDYIVPPAVAHGMVMQHGVRIRDLERRQDVLREAWGDEVGYNAIQQAHAANAMKVNDLSAGTIAGGPKART